MSAYLTYTEESNGTVSLVWKKETVPNAILIGVPTSVVPQYKFKSEGVTRLVTGAHNAKVFYQGVCSFLKAVALYNCEVSMLMQPARYSLLVVFLDNENRVYKLQNNSLNISCMRVAAAVNKHCQDYDTKTLNPQLFVARTTMVGGFAIELQHGS